ncbi:unnamed protein product, partial [Meganyctiphanes norvegica]
FMKFIRKLGEGSKTEKEWSEEFLSSTQGASANSWSNEFLQGRQQQKLKHDRWAQEFADAQRLGTFDKVTVDSENMSSQEKEDFWQNLQDEWDKMAKEDDLAEHPWLSEFNQSSSEPFK